MEMFRKKRPSNVMEELELRFADAEELENIEGYLHSILSRAFLEPADIDLAHRQAEKVARRHTKLMEEVGALMAQEGIS